MVYQNSISCQKSPLTPTNERNIAARQMTAATTQLSRGDVSVFERLGLIGDSKEMRGLRREIERIAPLNGCVLLRGETGTGKELVPRAIHHLSGRDGALIPLNLAAAPDDLADAELFGHQRGAFTGAIQSRKGAFVEADRGTIFLDEVGDASSAVQCKLLRVLEDGVVRPLGGSPVSTNSRVVSASWRSLEDLVDEGEFRQDLMFRLRTFEIELPALRDRLEDLPQLCEHLLLRFQAELGKKRIDDGALELIASHDFPGNVRELSAILYRAAAFCHRDTINVADALKALPKRRRSARADDLEDIWLKNEKNISAAARAASMPRSTFRKKLSLELEKLGRSIDGPIAV